jgi:hypothetical protein
MVHSWTGKVIFPSGMELCCISSSSAPWWIMHTPRGGLTTALTSRRCRCYIQLSSPCHGAPWYISGRQILGDLGVPLFADHIRVLTATFDSELADLRNPRCLKRKPIAAGVGKPVEVTAGWPSYLNELCLALISRTPFGCLLWGFQWFFLICKANDRVHNAKFGYSLHSPTTGTTALPCAYR